MGYNPIGVYCVARTVKTCDPDKYRRPKLLDLGKYASGKSEGELG